MEHTLLAIFIGYNSTNLLGCENDAILFYKKLDIKNKFLLLNKQVNLENLEKILTYHKDQILNNYKEPINIFIFYSGHGYLNGDLCFHKKKVKALEIYELINKNFINKVNLFVILDCCHSGNFPCIKNFQQINNVSIIASSTNYEISTESLVNFDFNNKINKLYFGAFTYNLVKLLNKYKNVDIISIINDNEIWKKLELIMKKKISIIK